MPEINIPKSKLENGINILDLLYLNKVTDSKSEARRAIQGKGIRVNDEIILDDKILISKQSFKDKKYIKISYGKKKHYIIKAD